MFKKEIISLCQLYAVSPIHAGSGSATGAVDLPIQRERHTNWPHIQASAVKGAFRAHFRNFADNNAREQINQIFGSDEQDGWDKKKDNLPGAVAFFDAKILAFPVRSNIAPFVWVTSPAVLQRLENDLRFAGLELGGEIPNLEDTQAKIIGDNKNNIIGEVILEDAVVNAQGDCRFNFFKDKFNNLDRLLIISDKMFDYVVSSCTEIQTQIKIDAETGTAKDSALRYEELLPSDTVMYSAAHYSRQNFETIIQANQIKTWLEDAVKDFIQIGGDETLGRGICQISWINGGAK